MNIVTHLDPKYDHQYQGIIDEGIFAVRFNIAEMRWIAVHCMLTITDHFRVISEHIFGHLFSEIVSWVTEEKGALIISKNRPLKKDLEILTDKLIHMKLI